MRRPKYRNNEERIYMKVLPRIQNAVQHQEEALEVLEEQLALAKKEESIDHLRPQVIAQRALVLYAQKLLEAVTSCEPAICRADRELTSESDAWG